MEQFWIMLIAAIVIIVAVAFASLVLRVVCSFVTRISVAWAAGQRMEQLTYWKDKRQRLEQKTQSKESENQ